MMYSQGNYAQFGQRLPPPPPPPRPPFQQIPSAPQHPIVQQGLPFIPPGQPGPPAYAHASSAPMQLGPPVSVPPSGMLSSGQSYLIPLPPPPQVHGNTPIPHSYSTLQQDSKWTQNAHHISPPVPPPLGHPLPPRMPPPSPQGQPFYRGQAHQLLPGGVQGLQQAPPPTSSYFTPAPFGSFIQSPNESSRYNLPPPPPPSSPPPGPPPLPPSSPPPDTPLHPSSAPRFTAGDLSSNSNKRDDALRHNDNLNCEGGMGSKVSSLVIPSEGNLMSNLPPPPPKPAEERIVRKIEVLCQYIAKNGSEFEDMTRQKEVGNPEFGFLFGGQPGSEAAVAHEYFEWMKKKCNFACELLEGRHRSDSSLRPLGDGSSLQPDGATDAGISHSPVDSDMDMEDDITQTDESGMCNHESVVISNELDMAKQQHACDAEHVSAKDAISGTLFCSGSSVLVEEGANLSEDGIQFERSLVSGGDSVAVCPLDSKAEKCTISPHEDLSELNAPAAAGISSIKVPGELIKGASPFRLLQAYASDDSSENDNEPCLEDVSPAAVSPSVKAGAPSSDDFQTDLRSKDLSELRKGFGPLSESVVTCSLNMTSVSPERCAEVQGLEKNTDEPIAIRKAEQLDNKKIVDSGTSHKALEQKDDSEDDGIDAGPESGKFQKEETKYISTQLKVDEFGRLAKSGASGSDSDDLQYKRRRGKRGRSWSRSRSPHERRRRSPWRRREKRSRSRSRSPKKRSRSKSPSYRRGGESGGDRSRRDRAQLPVCYDYLRGKCFRGASCRYSHDSEKNEESRWYKSKQHYHEFPDRLKSTDKSIHEHDVVNSQEMQLYQDVHVSSGGATEVGDIYQDEKITVSSKTSEQPVLSEKDGEPLVTDVAEHNMSQGVTAEVQEMQDIPEEVVEPTNHLAETASAPKTRKAVQLVGSSSAPLLTDADGTTLLVDMPSMGSSSENMGDHQSQANLSDPVPQNPEYQTQQSKDNSASDPAHAQESAIPTRLSIVEPYENHISLIQSNTDTDHVGTAFSSSLHIPEHPSYSQLPLPLLSQVTHAPFPSQLTREYNIMPPTEKYPSHSASMETYPPYQAPLPYQHSSFSVPPASSWNPLPPPPPRPPHSVPLLQFQQSQMLPRNDYPSQTFVRPYAAELPTHPQAGEFHQVTYAPVQEPDRPVSNTEDFRPSLFTVSYPMTQQFGGSRLVGEDNFGWVPGKAIVSSNSFAQGNIHPQPMNFSRDSAAGRMQSYSGENLPPGGLPIPSSEGHPYLPPYSLQRPAADSISANLEEPGKMNSKYASDFLDRNQPYGMSNFAGSRISNHYNPYASTFDQPLSTKFSSNVFNQEKETSYSNKYGASFGLSHIPDDGEAVGSLTSKNMTSPNSARDFVQSLPRSGGDQYDPIFDSIEPYSNSFRTSDMDKKREGTDNSDIMLRVSGSNKPLDLEENSKHKVAGAVAASTSVENDEFGETADAEVGVVENGSPSSPIDLPNLTTGDVEIDQVKNPGKSKKNKDSRSMKLFKVSLANFVKEVLKPSWRQGNMSKEAFKTIVKKTVDKVSGAMKNHQVPKSQAKIDQYIDSSQRKLTKLVMNYGKGNVLLVFEMGRCKLVILPCKFSACYNMSSNSAKF